MDKTYPLQLLQQTEVSPHCPDIPKSQWKNENFLSLGQQTFPLLNPCRGELLPTEVLFGFPPPRNRHSFTIGNSFYTPHSCLISCSHSIRKHPPTRFKTEQLVCVRIVKILNQKRPLRPSAPTPFGHRILLVSSRNLDLAKQGRDMAQPAESNRWTSLGLLFHGPLNLENIPVLPTCVFHL